MITKTEQLDRARQLGRAAFHDQRACEPDKDADIQAMIKDREYKITPPGEAPTPAIFKAWRTGWMLENLASV